MQLYDTLTGTKRPLEPRDPGRVTLYACGPTVYDAPHLGHARNALTYDVLRRYLEWRGVEVHHVANVTDIDDNIINRAKQEDSTEPAVAAMWERVYVDAMDALDVLHPHDRPHATEYVDQMVAFVGSLLDRGVAYQTPSGVYLSVEAVDDYGALVHRSPAELREGAGARVDVDDDKRDPLDFAVWKAAKPGEPRWPAPWGDGRPGWHIECVAMSLDLLGEDFDIHGGGDDLAFPHHENERAEAVADGRRFARHWVHHAMVNVSGEKMSKSLGNFTQVTEVLEQHDPRTLRLLVLQTHYRKTMEINAEALGQAETALGRLDAFVDRLVRDGVSLEGATPVAVIADEFATAMDDDLGTPRALAIVFETVSRANTALDEGADDAGDLAATVHDLAGALGLRLGRARQEADDDAEIDELVAARQRARDAKDFAEADRIRDQLHERGVAIEDGAGATTWRRV
ncbi:MAG: cysteine--tRNA ligase [Acidimicrobiia bacterium]|nr:cysteine--tRNA ligase [Acidimicrobiia bacterium]